MASITRTARGLFALPLLASLAVGAMLLWQGDNLPRASAAGTPAAPTPAPPLTEAQLAALHLVPAWDITYTYVRHFEIAGTRPDGELVCCWSGIGPVTGVSLQRIEDKRYSLSVTVAGADSQSDCSSNVANRCIPKLTEYPASFTLLSDSVIMQEVIQFGPPPPGRD